ncbi:UNVERIFIED_CONTAM: DNA topoisomerase 2-alpha [Gekko kuhli]
MIRDKSMSHIKITIDLENNEIFVWNNGKGIPIVEHKVEKVCVPALIFRQLLTSRNYDDNKKIRVETMCREYWKLFKQTWTDNMSKAGQMTLKFFDEEDFSCITFQPDLAKVKMTILDKDIVAFIACRAYDVAGAAKDIKVFLNGRG